MAKLSDFTTARNPVAEQLVAANAGRVHRNFVDYRQTHVIETLGSAEAYCRDAVASVRRYGRDAVKAIGRRDRIHAALDRMLSKMNMTDADAPRLHAALDRLLDSNDAETQSQILGDLERQQSQNVILAEPNTLGQDEPEEDEEPEETDDDAEPNEKHTKTKIPYDKKVPSLDALQRSLNTAFGLDADDLADTSAARVIPPRREVTHNSGYLTDAQFISQHLDPNQLCVEAENVLRDISFKRQVDDCKRSYWSGLFYFLRSQPKGSRIRDIENQVCLSTLLMHTLGATQGAFGAY
jgi:hypothetical protein